jgi:hypothetical protein
MENTWEDGVTKGFLPCGEIKNPVFAAFSTKTQRKRDLSLSAMISVALRKEKSRMRTEKQRYSVALR